MGTLRGFSAASGLVLVTIPLVTEIAGVIPAAGYATRLQPLACSKEVLPVRGRPVMDYLVERMRAGGCTRLRVVTRAEKEDVVSHSNELAAEVVLANPMTLSESFLAGLEGLGADAIALVGFPDTIWEPVDGYRLLVRAVSDGCEIALGLFRARRSDLPRSDVVVVDRFDRVRRVFVKPSAPPSDVIWGCAAARVGSLAGLARAEWPGEYFDVLCRDGRDVRGFVLSDEWLDIGTEHALAEARAGDSGEHRRLPRQA
jgi:glucose-1-phosphate thymidylyltransferase